MLKSGLRIVSGFTAFCFLITQSAWAVPQGAGADAGNPIAGNISVLPPTTQLSAPDISALVNWHVPEAFGSVQDRFTGNAGKVIFHIQDTHGNYESQMHTAQILEMLLKGRFKDKIRLFAVEGASGRIDLSGFKIYPDKDVLKDISEYFLRQAVITGTEFFSIFSEDPILVHGAEDLDLYTADLKDFLFSHALEEQMAPVLDDLANAYRRTAGAVYGAKAGVFMQFLASYKKGDTKFSQYCEELAAFAGEAGVPLKPYPVFEKILSSIRIEKSIQTAAVEKERGALIAALEKKMVKEDLADLIGKSLLYRTGKISSDEFYDYLDTIASKYSIDWKSFKNLQGYIQMVRLQSSVKTRDLFSECDRIEGAIKGKWLETPLEKDFDAAQKKLTILDNLVRLKMSRADLDFYDKHKDGVTTAALSAFVQEVLAKVAVQTTDGWQVPSAGGATVIIRKAQFAGAGAVDAHLGNMQAFYEKALLRDHALVKNTLRMMDEKKLDAAVLVTGGFHSEGAMKLFKEKGISYVVVNPRLTKADQDELYLARMLNEELPLENFFSTVGNRIAIPVPFSTQPVVLKVTLPGGKEFDLNTASEKKSILQTLHAWYVTNVAALLEEKGQVTRAKLGEAINGLNTQPGMPVALNVRISGDRLEVLFGVTRTDAQGRAVPTQFVMIAPAGPNANLNEIQGPVTRISDAGGVKYVLAKVQDSSFATLPSAAPVSEPVVAAATPSVPAPTAAPAVQPGKIVDLESARIAKALAALAANAEDKKADVELKDAIAKKAQTRIPEDINPDKLSGLPEKLREMLSLDDAEELEKKITAMWEDMAAAESLEAATGTGPSVRITQQQNSRPLSDDERNVLVSVEEALLLAQEIAKPANAPVKSILSRLAQDRIKTAEALAARPELLDPVRESALVGERIVQYLSNEDVRRLETERRFLLATIMQRLNGAWTEDAYNAAELKMAEEFNLRPEQLMRLYLDAHGAARRPLTAIDQHARLQSLMLRYPYMSGEELRGAILAMFETNRGLQRNLEESLLVMNDGAVVLAESAENIAEETGVYRGIESADGLPEGTERTQALLVAVMGDKPEIMRHSMSVTRIVLKMAKELGLDSELTKKAVQSAQLHDLGKAVTKVFAAISVPRNLTPGERDIIGLHDEYSGIVVDAIREVPFNEDAGPYADALVKKMAELDAALAAKNKRWISIPESDLRLMAARIVQAGREVVQEVKVLPQEVLGGITGHHGKPSPGLKDNSNARLVNYLIELADETHAMKDARRYILAQGGKEDSFLQEHLLKKIDGDPALGTMGIFKMEEGNPAMQQKLAQLRGLIKANGVAMFGDVVGPYGEVLKLDVVEQILTQRAGSAERPNLASQANANPRLAEAIVRSNLRVVESPQQKPDGTYDAPLPEQKSAILSALLRDTDSLPPQLREWVMDPGRAPPVILNADAYLDLSPAQLAALGQGAPVILVGRDSEYGFKYDGRTSLTKTYKVSPDKVYAFYPNSSQKIQSLAETLPARRAALAVLDKIKKAQPITQPEYEALNKMYAEIIVPGSREDVEISLALNKTESVRLEAEKARAEMNLLEAAGNILSNAKSMQIEITRGMDTKQGPENEEFWNQLLNKLRKNVVVSSEIALKANVGPVSFPSAKDDPLLMALALNEALGYFPDRMDWRREQKEVLRRLAVPAKEARAPPALSRDQLLKVVQVTLQGDTAGSEMLTEYLVQMSDVLPGLEFRDLLKILLEARLQLAGKTFESGNTSSKITALDGVNGELFFREIAIRMILRSIFDKYRDVIDKILLAGSAAGDQRAYKLNLDIKLTSDYDVDIVLKEGLPASERESLIRQIKSDIEESAQKQFGLMEMLAPHIVGKDILEASDLGLLIDAPETREGEIDFLGFSPSLSYVIPWTAEVYLTTGDDSLPKIVAVGGNARGFEFIFKQLKAFEETRRSLQKADKNKRIAGLAKYVLRSADGYLTALGLAMTPAEIEEARQAEKSYEEAVVERVGKSGKFDEKQIALLDLLQKIRVGASVPEGLTEAELETFVADMLKNSAPAYKQEMAAAKTPAQIAVTLARLEKMFDALKAMAVDYAYTGQTEMRDKTIGILDDKAFLAAMFQMAASSAVQKGSIQDLRLTGAIFSRLLSVDPSLEGFTFDPPSSVPPAVAVQLKQGTGLVFSHEILNKLSVLISWIGDTKGRRAVSQLGLDELSKTAIALDGINKNITPDDSTENRVRIWLSYAYWQMLSKEIGNFLVTQKENVLNLVPKQRAFLERVMESIASNIAIFDARLHGVRSPVANAPVPIKQMVKNAIRSVRRDLAERYKDRGVEIMAVQENLDGIPDDLTAQVDRTRLYSTLDNLIQNAFEAMIEDPNRNKTFALSIAAKPTDDGGVEITLSDNGKGIDAPAVYAAALGRLDRGEIRDSAAVEVIRDLRDRVQTATVGNKPIPADLQEEIIRLLFQPLMTVGKAKGTGIGLDVVKKNMDEQWGADASNALGIASVPGAGTTLAIRFPGTRVAAAPAPEEAAAPVAVSEPETAVQPVPEEAALTPREIQKSHLRVLANSMLPIVTGLIISSTAWGAAGLLLTAGAGVAYGAWGGLPAAVRDSKNLDSLLALAGVGSILALAVGFFRGLRERLPSPRSISRFFLFAGLFFLATPAPAMAYGGIASSSAFIQALGIAFSAIAAMRSTRDYAAAVNALNSAYAVFSRPEWEEDVVRQFLNYQVPPGSRLANLLLGLDRDEVIRRFTEKLVAQSLADLKGLGKLQDIQGLEPAKFFAKVREYLEGPRGEVPAAVLYLYAETLYERWQRSESERYMRWQEELRTNPNAKLSTDLDANFNAAYNILSTERGMNGLPQGEFWIAVQREFKDKPAKLEKIEMQFGLRSRFKAETPGTVGSIVEVVPADYLYPELQGIKNAGPKKVSPPAATIAAVLQQEAGRQVNFRGRYLINGAISSLFLFTMASTAYGGAVAPAVAPVALTAGLVSAPLLLAILALGNRFFLQNLQYFYPAEIPAEAVLAPVEVPPVTVPKAPQAPAMQPAALDELPLDAVRGELRRLLKDKPALFDGILKEGDRALYAKGLNALIEQHPAAVLSLLASANGPVLKNAVRDPQLALPIARLIDSEQSLETRRFIAAKTHLAIALMERFGDADKAIDIMSESESAELPAAMKRSLAMTAYDTLSLAVKPEKLGRALDLNYFVFRNEQGKVEARADAPAALLDMLKSVDVALFSSSFDPEEQEAVFAAIAKQYGVRPASKFVLMEKFDGSQKAARDFRAKVYGKVQEVAGKQLAEHNIVIIPTSQTYLDIFRQEAGNVLFMLFSGANQVVLSGNMTEALKDQAALLGGSIVTDGGVQLDLIIETRATFEDRAKSSAIAQLSA